MENYEFLLDKNIFYTSTDILPMKSSYKKSLLIHNKEIYDLYTKEDLMDIDIQGVKTQVSKNLIHAILKDKAMRDYVQSNLISESSIGIRLFYIDENYNAQESININRVSLAEAIKEVINIPNELDKEENINAAIIMSTLTSYSLFQQFGDPSKIYTLKTSKKDIFIPYSTILEIFTADDNTFNRFLEGKYNSSYDVSEIAYAIVDFISKKRILEKYIIGDHLYERYLNLSSYKLVDFQHLKHNIDKKNNFLVEDINISDEFMDEIEEYKKDEYSDFESSLYYYIRLCELTTLDQGYIASSKSSEDREYHERIDVINSISSDNNDVITFDFIHLYAFFLNKLGIDYEIDSNLIAGDNEGSKKLTYGYGKYLIVLDSIEDLSNSDLTNVKINDRLSNIRCINDNESTVKEFEEKLYKVYSEIVEMRKNKEQFEDSLNQYKLNYNDEKLSINDKLYMLLKLLSNKELTGIDMISYEKKVFDNILGNNPDIKLNFVVNKNENNKYSVTPIMLLSLFSNNDYVYFVINPNDKSHIERINRDELAERISNETYLYMENGKNIPGIDSTKGKVYVK